ncbi:MAG: ATP-binding protein [Chloroflexota bacterium]|nr:ATP-binding protein [Chloroflexota bacterium]
MTAFLILAIVPLSGLSWYATRRERRDIQREVTAKLSAIATMTEAQVRQWAEARVDTLGILASSPSVRANAADLMAGPDDADLARQNLRDQLNAALEEDSAFRRLALLDLDGRVLASTDRPAAAPLPKAPSAFDDGDDGFRVTSLDPAAASGALVTRTIRRPSGSPVGLLAGWLDLAGLASRLRAAGELGQGAEVYVVGADGRSLPQGQVVTSAGIEVALSGEEARGLFQSYADVPVIGVYRWMSDLQLALVAEQSQEEAFATADTVTAAVVGATLLVALVTAIIAAVVTRQITRPVVQLTESALRIAQGDLDQRVPVRSRDEIGILASVFNRMASELKSLYEDLESKVAERTAMLQKANYQIQRRAIQLAATVEVSQAATSILEPGRLLQRVVRLIHDRFGYSYVGVYLLDEGAGEGEELLLLRQGTGGGDGVECVKREPVPLHGEDPLTRAVTEAMATGEACVREWDRERAAEVLSAPHICVEAALPLKMGDQIIGVLDILNTEPDDIDADAISVLQNVANQITIALENARIYEREKEIAERLRRTEAFRSRFLAHMSRELREPLTNIIGFSRLILKGLDGPINDQQRRDVDIIHANSEHLLGLINDLLDVSQIEAGLMELDFQELHLPDVIDSVMATTSALVRDKDIELRREVDDLPPVRADGARIRQVLLKLLTNAAKFTEQGCIAVRAWSEGCDGSTRVCVSVSDTGRGISPEDQQRVFERFEQGTLGDGRRPNGAGLGLALSKEFVEMHGGEIWVESEPGTGSTFTFSLPLTPGADEAEPAGIT